MKRLAIIPARGGSKRIPNKNIKNFMGKPMILHILETCRKSNLFDKIHVSTDSPKIKDVAAQQTYEGLRTYYISLKHAYFRSYTKQDLTSKLSRPEGLC